MSIIIISRWHHALCVSYHFESQYELDNKGLCFALVVQERVLTVIR